MATKSKTTAKPKTARKSTAKPKTKTAAKPKTAKRSTAKPKPKTEPKPRKMRTVKLASGRKIARPVDPYQFGSAGTVRSDGNGRAAEIASALACTDGTGSPLNRARIGSVQIAEVRELFGKSKPTQTATAKLSGMSWPETVGYADAKLGRTEVDTAALRELAKRPVKSRSDGKSYDDRKINGRALAAALVGIAVADGGAKMPTGKLAPTTPVRETVKRK